MCDTLVALGNSTVDGSVLLAKNSDRQPNEPHIMIRIPRMRHDLEQNKYVKTTYIEIPQVEHTYGVVLLKPSWIWGCEMGWNEFGLNIGNEAVFTKEKKGASGLTGMDMVRIALERCKTCEETVELLADLLEAYGQGGNCGYEKPFTYHNSFLIADRASAWVFETAGRFWAAKQVKDTYCISNCLSIGKDFDKSHPNLIRHAIEKGWCKSEADFEFAKCYSDKLYTHFSGSIVRREACESTLQAAKGNIDVGLMKKILRGHAKELDGRLFQRGSVKSVCMHAGGMIGDHTTGSYIASIDDKICTYWVTGASTPCISVFKPLWIEEEMPIFSETEQAQAIEYWKLREKLHRHILQRDIDLSEHRKLRDSLEQEIEEAMPAADLSDGIGRSGIMKQLFAREEDFIRSQLARCTGTSNRIKGRLHFRRYWKKQNEKL
ncbi:MAG: peptidase U34 [Clostridiaceae bacterium]|jgi:hypothetical protein|nr:peptidase U34 [Clostridiaceae bacterium]